MRTVKTYVLIFIGCCLSAMTYAQVCTRTNFGTTNLVSNGDFSAGNDGSFSSDYTYVAPPPGSLGGGQYSVDTDAQIWNNTWFRTPLNHNGGGDLPGGNFYLADGGSNTTDDVYRTDVNVVGGNAYIFSVWVANIHTNYDNPPEMEFYVGTDNIGSLLTSSTSNDWQQFYAIWTAPSSGVFTIALRNAATGSGGNDLAIDNVFFTRDCDNLVNYTIDNTLPDTITSCTVGDTTFVTGLNTTLYDFEWFEETDLVNNLGTGADYTTNVSGKYYVCIDPKGLGCPLPDSVVLIQSSAITVSGGVLDCPTRTADFIASTTGAATFHWYDQLEGGTLLGAGSPFTTPSIGCVLDTFYVENADVSQPTSLTGGYDFSDGTEATQWFQGFQSMNFDAKEDFELISVDMKYQMASTGSCGGPTGISFGIRIRDNTNAIIHDVTPTVACGSGTTTITVPLGWDIPAGTDYEIELYQSGTGAQIVHLDGGSDYSAGGPLDNDIFHITQNSHGQAWSADHYGSFFNWVVEVDRSCPRTAAIVTDNCAAVEICGNGVDDDCDGLIDCYDPDCLGTCGDFYYGQPTPLCQQIPAFDPDFGLDTVWKSNFLVEGRTSAMVGDVDNDGVPEIVGHHFVSDSETELAIGDGATGALEVILTDGVHYIDQYNSSTVIADVDGDGYGEIFAVYNDEVVRRWEHDGTFTWASPSLTAHHWGVERWNAATADFNSDGVPEIYLGNVILNSVDGSILIQGTGSRGLGVGGHATSVAADVLPDDFCADCDGLELVAGNEVYAVNIGAGTMTLASSTTEPEGAVSIADWDCDDSLDVIVSAGATREIYIWNPRLGTADKLLTTGCGGAAIVNNPIDVSGGVADGPGMVNVGDFDGDGYPEFGVASDNLYSAVDNDMTFLWQDNTVVDGSAMTASSTFDFEGDGAYEVVYRDEDSLYIYDGATGARRATTECRNGTRFDMPVVADVNGDGEANILCTCQQYTDGTNARDGHIMLFTSNTNTWVKTRKIWNQHSYNPVVIGDDLQVPANQQNHALVPRHNIFIAQAPNTDVLGDIIFNPLPDFVVQIDSVSTADCGVAGTAYVQISNGAPELTIPASFEVSFYDGDPAAGGTLIGTMSVNAGNSTAIDADTRAIEFPVTVNNLDLYVVVNDDGTDPVNAPATTQGECDSTNNVDNIAVSCNAFCADPGTVTLSPAGPINICGGSQELTASETGTPPAGGFEYEFFYDDGTGATAVQGPGTDNTYDASLSGDYYVVVTDPSDAATCVRQSAVVVVTIAVDPTVAAAGGDESVCGTSATLDGNNPVSGSGTWQVIAGAGTFTDSSVYNTDVSNLGAGANTFRWTITTGGVCADSEDDVIITRVLPPSTAEAGVDDSICSVDALIMAATDPTSGTGTWSVNIGSGTFTTNNDHDASVSGLTTGVNEFLWTVATGAPCADSTDVLTIVVSDPPSTANAGSPQTICGGNGVTLAANAASGNETGTWSTSGDGTFANENDEGTLYTPGATDQGNGTVILTWTLSTTSQCTPSTDDVVITINEGPKAAVSGPDQSICAGNNAQLAANAATGSETGTWGTSGDGNFSGQNDENATYAPGPNDLLAGSVDLTWSLSTGGTCSATDSTMTLTIESPPQVADAGSTQTLCEGASIVLAGNAAAGTENGLWTSSGDGSFSDSTDHTASYIPGNADVTGGTVTLTWTLSTSPQCTPETSDVVMMIEQAPGTSDAGPDQNLCETATVSLAANTPSNGMGGWSLVSGAGTFADAASSSSGVSGLNIGANVFRWTVSTGGVCTDSTSEVTITIDEEPSIATTAGDFDACTADPIFLTGNNPTVGTGVWSLGASTTGGTIDDVNLFNSGVSGMAGGDVLQTIWTISNGVCPPSSDTTTITGAAIAAPLVSLSINDAIVCTGDAVLFTASGNNGGTSPQYEFFDANGPTSLQGPGAGNTYAIPATSSSIDLFVVMESNSSCLGPNSPFATSDTISLQVDQLPSTAEAGTPQTVCADNAVLAADVPGVGVGAWSVISGPGVVTSINDPSSTVTGLQEDSTVTLQWTISNGECPSNDDQVQIVRSGAVTQPDAGPAQTLCETEDALLSANVAGSNETAQWSSAGDGSFDDDGLSSATYTLGVADIAAGSVDLTWTIDNGVCSPVGDVVTISIDALPGVAEAGPDQLTICGTSTVLAADAALEGQGTWSVSSGSGNIAFADLNDPSATITGLDGTTEVSWTLVNGQCLVGPDVVTLEATVPLDPVVALTPDLTEACEGDQITFTATPSEAGASPEYEFFLGTTSVQSLSSDDSYSISTLVNGESIRVVMTPSTSCINGGPTFEAIAAVPITSPPTISITNDTAACELVSISASISSGAIQWFESTDAGDVAIAGEASETLTLTQTGTYFATASLGVCAPVASNVSLITVDQIPSVEAGDEQTVFVGSSITMMGNSNATTGVLWSVDNGEFSDASDPQSLFTGITGGDQVFVLTATSGTCQNSDEVVIKVREPIIIPNTFTPNDDGVNDVWEIRGLDTYPNAVIVVYNRWGSEVYRWHGTYEPWNGQRNGKDLPQAVYYYVLFPDGESEEMHGDVTIIR